MTPPSGSGPAGQNGARPDHTPKASKARKNKSILELTADAASPFDRARFEAAVTEFARRGVAFRIETVLEETGMVELDSPNRVGALTAGLHTAGVIRRIGYTTASKRSAHGRVVSVWVAGDGR